MTHHLIIVVTFFVAVLSLTSALTITKVIAIRGGIRPASQNPDQFFKQFDLDYGTVDDRRPPGFLRGFVSAGKMLELPSTDPFITWLYEHMEKGKAHADERKRFNRPKAYYAADFGTKADLKKGENPKLIIVNNRLAGDNNGILLPGPKKIDIEVRELWQPWSKWKCNFAVRYIVPNRDSILKLMEAQGRFRQELIIENKETEEKTAKKSFIQLTFKPTLLQRMRGKTNIVLKTPIDNNLI